VKDDILAGIAEGLIAPRRAMRRVLAQKPGIETVLGLVVLAYAIQGMASILVPGARGEPGGASLLLHLNLLVSQLVLFAMTAAAVFGLGRIFGGTGNLPQSLTTIAWYSFITSFLAPFALYGLTAAAEGEGTALSALLLLGASAIGLWVFAGCVAELHGFRSTAAVLGASVGVMLLVAAFVLIIAPAP